MNRKVTRLLFALFFTMIIAGPGAMAQGEYE
jgi:hypothetical protein